MWRCPSNDVFHTIISLELEYKWPGTIIGFTLLIHAKVISWLITFTMGPSGNFSTFPSARPYKWKQFILDISANINLRPRSCIWCWRMAENGEYIKPSNCAVPTFTRLKMFAFSTCLNHTFVLPARSTTNTIAIKLTVYQNYQNMNLLFRTHMI